MARGFNGSTDQIAAGVPSTAYSLFTASCWLNFSAAPGAGTAPRLVSNAHTDGDNTGFQLFFEQAASKFHMNVGNGTSNVMSDFVQTPTIGAWYQLVGIYDGTNPNVYLNGAAGSVVGGPLGGSMAATAFNLLIGHAVYAGDGFPGFMADVAIWNTNLNSTQISQLASGRRPPSVNTANLVGYWPLDGYASPEPDLSGNANNGTLTGTSQVLGPPIVSRAMGS